MSINTVRVIAIDPYHKVYGMLTPLLAQKMIEAMEAMGDENGLSAYDFMSQLWAKSPNVLLLGAIDTTGRPKGFCAATIIGEQVFMLQPKLDEPTENDAVTEMIDLVKAWAGARGVKQVTLIARRSDPKWLKKHGFTVERYIMVSGIE